MELFEFDCNSNNAPAYSCNHPNDNSGFYFRAEEVEPIIHALRRILAAHKYSTVDWEAMKDVEKLLEGDCNG